VLKREMIGRTMGAARIFCSPTGSVYMIMIEIGLPARTGEMGNVVLWYEIRGGK